MQVHEGYERVTLILFMEDKPNCTKCSAPLVKDEVVLCEGQFCDVRSCHPCRTEYHITWRTEHV